MTSLQAATPKTVNPSTGVLREMLGRSAPLESLAANSVDIAYVIFSLLLAIDIFLVCHGISIAKSFKVFHSLCKKVFPTTWNGVDGIGALATVFSRHREQQKPIEEIALRQAGHSGQVANDDPKKTIQDKMPIINVKTGDDRLINYLDIFNGTQLLTVQALAYTPLLSATFNVIAPGFAFALSMGLTAIAETIKYQQANTIVQQLNLNQETDSSDPNNLLAVREKHKLTAIAYGVCFVAMLAMAVAATVTTGGTPMIVLAAGMLFSAVVRSYVNLANNGYLKDSCSFSTLFTQPWGTGLRTALLPSPAN